MSDGQFKAIFMMLCAIFMLLFAMWLMGFLVARRADAAPPRTFATWYSVASCEKESGQHIMANGEPLDDSKFTCASWDYDFGTILEVTNTANGRTVSVVCTDRGPSRRLYRKGVIVDLTEIAFKRLAPLEKGRIGVRVERIDP